MTVHPVSSPLDIDTLRAAVEALWHGLEEEGRFRFSGFDVTHRAEGGRLVSARYAEGGVPVLVVSLAAVNAFASSNPDKAWRAEVAREMRACAAGAVRATSPTAVSTRRSEVGTAATAPADAARASFERFSAAIDCWSVADAGGECGEARSPAPGPASSAGGDDGRAAAPTRPASGPWWRILKPVVGLVAAPARAAFRARSQGPLGAAVIWAWRAGVIGGYLVILLGVGYLVWSGAALWSTGGGGAAAIAIRPEGAPVEPAVAALESVEAGGQQWVVPRGWTVQRRDGLVRWSGPTGAAIELAPLGRASVTGVDLARLCAAGERAYASAGGAGLEFVDLRLERADGVWISRCLVTDGALLRATAPRLVFVQESLGEWLLLAALNVHWQATAGQARGRGGAGG